MAFGRAAFCVGVKSNSGEAPLSWIRATAIDVARWSAGCAWGEWKIRPLLTKARQERSRCAFHPPECTANSNKPVPWLTPLGRAFLWATGPPTRSRSGAFGAKGLGRRPASARILAGLWKSGDPHQRRRCLAMGFHSSKTRRAWSIPQSNLSTLRGALQLPSNSGSTMDVGAWLRGNSGWPNTPSS